MIRSGKLILSCLLVLSATLLAGSAPAMASAALEPSTPALEFGPAEVHGGSFPQQTISFLNGSLLSTTVESVSITGPDAGDFSLPQDNCNGAIVEITFSCDVEVRFQPQLKGAKSATLQLVESFGTIEIPLSGTGTTGTLSASPLEFGLVRVGENQSEQVTIENSLAGTHIASLEINGPDFSSFSIVYGNCVENTLGTGNSCGVGVRFEPSSPGAQTAELVVHGDASDDPLVIPLSGSGAAGPVLEVSPRQALLGNVPVGSTVEQKFKVSNVGDYPLALQGAFVTSGTPLMFPLITDGCSGHYLEPGASCTFSIGFAPSTPGAKSASVIIITNSSAGVSAVGLEGTGVEGNGATTTAVSPSASPAAAVLAGALRPVALPQLTSAPSHSTRRSVNSGIVALCPASVTVCRVRTLIATNPAATRHHKHSPVMPLGTAVVTLRGGQSAPIFARLSRGGATLLRRRHRLKVSITVVITTAGAPPVTQSRALTIGVKRGAR